MTGSTEAHHYVCWFEVTGRIATYEFWMPQATYAAEEPVLIAMGEAAEYPPSPPVDAGGS